MRSDSMAHLTPVGRAAMVAYGVTMVIDLRTDAELQSAPNPCADTAGLAYRHLPLVDDSGMVALGELAEMFERYLWMLDGRPEAFRAIFETVAAADGAVVFHCFAGKDRTGLVAALLLGAAGVPNEAIAADFAETDAQLAVRYEEWLAAAAPERRSEMRQDFRCPPERILGVMDHIQKRWGGVQGYMEATGMTPATVDRLRAKLA